MLTVFVASIAVAGCFGSGGGHSCRQTKRETKPFEAVVRVVVAGVAIVVLGWWWRPAVPHTWCCRGTFRSHGLFVT